MKSPFCISDMFFFSCYMTSQRKEYGQYALQNHGLTKLGLRPDMVLHRMQCFSMIEIKKFLKKKTFQFQLLDEKKLKR